MGQDKGGRVTKPDNQVYREARVPCNVSGGVCVCWRALHCFWFEVLLALVLVVVQEIQASHFCAIVGLTPLVLSGER